MTCVCVGGGRKALAAISGAVPISSHLISRE